MKPTRSVDTSAAVVAILLVGVAGVTLWQSREFTAFAAIFPRAVGTALLVCSLLALWRILRAKVSPRDAIDGNGLLRSTLLVLVLLAWVAMMEIAGFALSSCVGFFVLTVLANRDPLGWRRVLGYAVVTIVERAVAAAAFPARAGRAPSFGDMAAWPVRLIWACAFVFPVLH